MRPRASCKPWPACSSEVAKRRVRTKPLIAPFNSGTPDICNSQARSYWRVGRGLKGTCALMLS